MIVPVDTKLPAEILLVVTIVLVPKLDNKEITLDLNELDNMDIPDNDDMNINDVISLDYQDGLLYEVGITKKNLTKTNVAKMVTTSAYSGQGLFLRKRK